LKPREEELEDLIVQLDCTLADMETAKRKGYLRRDLATLREEANRIWTKRKSRSQ
jgi:hypothetical protein